MAGTIIYEDEHLAVGLLFGDTTGEPWRITIYITQPDGTRGSLAHIYVPNLASFRRKDESEG